MSCLKLYLSHKPLLEFFFHGLTALVGLGLILKASRSHSGVDYMLFASEMKQQVPPKHLCLSPTTHFHTQ